MSENSWTWIRDEQIPNDAAKGREIVSEMLAHLESDNWSENDLFGIHLAVEEALVNAIKHGNQMDPEKQIEIKISSSLELVRIEIADQGEGFVPEDVPDPTAQENLELPCGRGIMLMRSFMSHVEYNDVGNRVVMEKKRAG